MSEEQGYIKLYRSLLDWEWYADINTKCLFIHLLLICNHKDNIWKGKEIKRGQTFSSISHLAKSTGLSEMMVRTSLKKLKKSKNVTCDITSEGSLITICNYNTYQSSDLPSNKPINKRVTSEQQANNKRVTTNNNDKNDKNENNEEDRENKFSLVDKSTDISQSKKFQRPTIEEILEYANQNEKFRDIPITQINQFYYFYESKGWKVGKETMKNWRIALAGWCERYRSSSQYISQHQSQIPSQSQSQSLWDDKPTDTPEQREINAKVRAEKESLERRRQAYELRKQLSNN